MPESAAGSASLNSTYRFLLRTLLLLSFPTIVEEVLSTLLQYVDTAMVGQLGEQATASVSITTNVTWLVNSVAGAAGTAVLVLISRAAGAGDKKQVKKRHSYQGCCWRSFRLLCARIFRSGWEQNPGFRNRLPAISLS